MLDQKPFFSKRADTQRRSWLYESRIVLFLFSFLFRGYVMNVSAASRLKLKFVKIGPLVQYWTY